MTKTINYAKLSANMTPKERAKLIVELAKKGMLDAYPDPDKPISTEAEIREVVAACPSSQAKEYNFLISLKDYVWNRYLPLLEYTVLELEVLVARFYIYVLVVSRDTFEEEVAYDAELLEAYTKKVKNQLVEISNYKGAIELIQDKHFDGIELLPGDNASPLGTLPRVPKKVDGLVDEYNRAVRLHCIIAKVDIEEIEKMVLETAIDTYMESKTVEKKVSDAEYMAR